MLLVIILHCNIPRSQLLWSTAGFAGAGRRPEGSRRLGDFQSLYKEFTGLERLGWLKLP